MSQIHQGEMTVVICLVLGGIYWGCAMLRRRDCDIKMLVYFVADVFGCVGGALIVNSCPDVMKVSIQSGIVSGIAGGVIALASLTDIVKKLGNLIRKEVEPKRMDSSPTN